MITLRRVVAAILLVSWSASGCHQYEWPGKPVAFQTTRISGRLSAAGRPIRGGWLILFPLERTRGDHVVVSADEHGNFAAERVPIGALQVRVKLPAQERAALARDGIVDEQKLTELAGIASPWRIETTRGSAAILMIDLVSGAAMRRE